tara:strand:- start:1297 stop:1767 length:471 start_codon:yes stop_codon:yes gene_type:complete
MANELAARSVQLKIATGVGDTLVAVPNMTDFSLSQNATEIDITAYGNAGFRDYAQGMRDMTMDFTFLFPQTNTGPTLPTRDLIHSMEEKTGDDATDNAGGKHPFSLSIDGTNTYLAGTLMVTSLGHEFAMDDMYRVSVSARICGTPTTYDWLHAAL